MLILFASALAAPAEKSATVPATGRQAVVFDLERFGRYAVIGHSSQGTAVRVVDRMTGAGPVHGEPGEASGRVDLFLDRGEIQVVALSDPRGTGEATVRVVPFAQPPGEPPRLDEERLVHGALADLEQRAYWIDVPEARTVAIEAAGRYLADVRLWQDGNWLVDTAARCVSYEPVKGQPWTRCQWVGKLEPGLYLVGAYGGEGRPWAEASSASPFQVRWGVPRIASAGRRTEVLDDSGVARFRTSSAPTVFHLSLPDVAPVSLAVAVSDGDPFLPPTDTGSITSESRRPTTSVRAGGTAGRIVTVTGPPGQVYTLTWFTASSGTEVLDDPGRYFVGTLHAAHPADVAEPTAVLYRRTTPGQIVRAATQGVPLDRSHRYERSFNLAEPVRMLLDVTEAGPYLAAVEGTPAQLRIVPFFVGAAPKDWQPPDYTSGRHAADLAVGLHVLELRPGTPGIATVTVAHDSWASRAKNAVGWGPETGLLRPAVAISPVEVEYRAPLELQVLRPPGDPMGVVVRALPIDPRDALPLALLPGEIQEIPIVAEEEGTLEARTPEGRALPVHVGDDPEGETVQLPPGEHLAAIRNDSDGVALVSLVLRPTRLDPEAPLPPLDDARLAALPDFPDLTAEAPAALDLERERTATYAVSVGAPGLYRLQSTGLLQTRGNLRTRVRTRVATAQANGVGRNFLIASYFREGDYQLTVGTMGASMGHLGVALDRTEVLDGGELADGVPARITVPAGDAVRMVFRVADAGFYALRHEGRTGVFECRVEDDGGWPLEAPEQPCDWEGWLEPGRYVVIGLPEQIETRRITTLTRRPDPVDREGHGPFALRIGEDAGHTWVEPTDGGERVPDTWQLDVPAPVFATVTLSAEMAAELEHDGAVDRIVPGVEWRGELGKGPLVVRVRGARRGTGVPYLLRVDTRELVAGTTRAVELPARIPVAVGQEGVHAIWSTGATDVRARLLAGAKVIAANDDRPDDWNFQLAPRLEPGDYTLVLDPIDGRSDATIAMRVPAETEGPELRSGTAVTLRPGRDAVISRIDAGGTDVVVAEARAGENVGVAIEASVDGLWRGVAHGTGRRALAVGRLPEKPDRVRIRTWSEDGRGGEVTLVVRAIRSRRTAESVLAGGPSVGDGWGALRAEGGAGVFALLEDARATWVCGEVAAPCVPGGDGIVAASDDGLVLVRERGTVRARRVELDGGEPVAVRLDDERVTFDVSGGRGPVVFTVRGASGQPGADVDGGDGTGVAPGAAIGVALSGGRRARAWDAAGEGPIDARVSVVRLEPPDPRPAKAGREAITVPAKGAVMLELPTVHDGELALDRGVVAVLGQGRVVWADPDPRMVEVPGLARSLVLLNPTDADAFAVLELRAATAPPPLAPGRPIEEVHTAARTLVLPVAPAGDGALRVLGPASATLVRADGRVLVGDGAPVGPGGVLHLAVRPGPVLAWVENPGQLGPRRPVEAGRTIEIGASGAVPLAGEAVRVKVSAGAAGVVHLRAPCPMVAEIEVPKGYSRTEVLPAGGGLDLWLPEGTADVLLRALAGTALYGEAVLAAGTVADLGEGLGPEVLLAPGGSALFRFVVERDGRVGIGVRATADRVEATLLDATGRPQGRGLVQMPELVAGTWLLSLSQPADAAPVRARAAIAGIVPPPHGPPADVVRRYLEGDPASASAEPWFVPAEYGEESEGEYVEETYEEEGEYLGD